ncbi:MAG: alpha-1,2-mannosyltransferase [Azoarcus sp.]|nr:alpha-1,2-mannosyltransferase [Azoarcus sp.]
MKRPLPAITAMWMVAVAYAAFIGSTLVDGYRAAARGDVPLYTDYTPTYAASMLVQEIPAENLYRPRFVAEAGRRAAVAAYPGINSEQARGVGFAPWMYPPTFILLVLPLAYLPYLASWLAWLAATAVPFLAAIRTIIRGPAALPFALSAPPVFFNVMYGQNGFLTAGLIGLGLARLRDRPLWAGILIGLASVKPHLGILIPLALIAGGYWRAFAAATLTVIATIVASLVAFGDDPWFGFIGATLFHLDGFGAGAYNFAPMTTVLATARMAGSSMESAWAVQYAASAAMAAITGWVWWRGRRHPATHGLQCAVLCLATPLALPMIYLYDLVLVVPAVAWLWVDLRRRGARHVEFAVLGLPFAALLAVKWVATTFGIQIGAACVAVLLSLALNRFRHALNDQADTTALPDVATRREPVPAAIATQ